MIRIDAAWLRAHPLPAFAAKTDKNDRGRVLVVGGSRMVPGALRLTGEAVLRAGAGKVQLATVEDAALMLGMMMPEAGVIPLEADADGEIDGCAAGPILADALQGCDALVLGPGMSANESGAVLLSGALKGLGAAGAAVLDAAAIMACRDCLDVVRAQQGGVVLTPHAGEMAALTGRDAGWIGDNMERAACEAAEATGAVIVLKAAQTVVATPGRTPLLYGGGGPGLATGGSGDVLAGMLGGLLSRGTEAETAAAWAVWAHGEAGRERSAELGGPGLLARELPERLPRLLCERPPTEATPEER